MVVYEMMRSDPYKNFKFRVIFDGRVVAGVNKVTALERTSEVIDYRQAGDTGNIGKTPGRNKFEPITLERGVTLDKQFEAWASDAQHRKTKHVTIELYDEAGQKACAYRVRNCWVSKFQSVADRDANVIIESLTLENEGWELSATV